MKRILKRIGLLGLIIALLAPFTKLPVVNAEETTDCTKHLQNYMFLDVLYPHEFYFGEDPYTEYHENYTVFPYVFTNIDSSSIDVKSVTTNYLTTSSQISKYSDLYHEVYNYSKENNNSLYASSKYKDGKIFISEDDAYYDSNTILLHGRWSDENVNELLTPNWPDFSSEAFPTIQKALNYQKISGVEIEAAVYNNGNYSKYFEDSSETNLADYFNDIANKNYTKTGAVYKTNQKEYVALKITRNLNNLNNIVFGYVKDGEAYKFTDLDAFKNWAEDFELDRDGKLVWPLTESYVSPLDDPTKIDVDVYKQYYWPVVLNVVYEVCPLADTTEKWTITYHDNVSDAEITVPAQQTEKVGTNMKTSTTKPERSGYVFQKWCESANGSGQCYTAGQEVTSPKEGKDIPLYAIWGSTEAVDNPNQGVISYIIGFAAVGVVAGGIYLISKKKNLFKQI